MKISNMTVTVLALSLALQVSAHEGESHGAHEHGIGNLDLAIDGSMVELELDSPAINLVGFEHEPKNYQERSAVDRAVKALRDGAALFGLDREAHCQQRDVRVASPLVGHDGPDKDAGTKEDHPDGAGHVDEDDEHGHEHADIFVAWKFECGDPAALRGLDAARFFGQFGGTEKLRLQAATPRGQKAAELTAKKAKLTF